MNFNIKIIILSIAFVSCSFVSASYNNKYLAIFRRFPGKEMYAKVHKMCNELEFKLRNRKAISSDYLNEVEYLNNYCLYLHYRWCKDYRFHGNAADIIKREQLQYLLETNTPNSLKLYNALEKHNSCWM